MRMVGSLAEALNSLEQDGNDQIWVTICLLELNFRIYVHYRDAEAAILRPCGPVPNTQMKNINTHTRRINGELRREQVFLPSRQNSQPAE